MTDRLLLVNFRLFSKLKKGEDFVYFWNNNGSMTVSRNTAEIFDRPSTN